jgi:YHS domain-containing protein
MKRFFSLAVMLCLVTLFAACGKSNNGVINTSADKAVEAGKSTNGLDPVNKIEGGPALNGYDTVAYFQEGRAVEGNAEFSHQYMGAKWLFSNPENRDLFSKAPQKYAPQYGGYCSWAVGHGYTANGDPRAWKIVNGKLYFNYNEDVKQKWEKEEESLIQKGDDYWPRFLEKKPEHKG